MPECRGARMTQFLPSIALALAFVGLGVSAGLTVALLVQRRAYHDQLQRNDRLETLLGPIAQHYRGPR